MATPLPDSPRSSIDRPPAYTARETPAYDDSPSLTAAFANLQLKEVADKPTIDQCLAHLKLLEAFHQLREDVATTDGLYGIDDGFIYAVHPGQENRTQQAALLLKLREKRWAIYVTKAAKRYERWWQKTTPTGTSMPTQHGLIGVYMTWGQNEGTARYHNNSLPPLDVLMVWHAHLLNPRDFLEDCIRYGRTPFWNTGLPLATIDTCINNDNLEYNAGDQAPTYFTETTGLPWNSLEDNTQFVLQCTGCSQSMHVPWTTASSLNSWKGPNPGELETGFADPHFMAICKECQVPCDHDALRAQKFRLDCKALLDNNLPMPGTILDLQGRPDPPEFGNSIDTHPGLFPNRLLKAGLATSILDILHPSRRSHWSPTSTVNSIRTQIETGLDDKAMLEKARGGIFPPSREEKVAVRKMMSRYWTNSSIFALDLVGAVIRQGSFIEKMHAIDWLHSPAVRSTMQRLLLKYDRHTHQLCPPKYYRHCISKTSRFVDHDDKIPATTITTSFEWTSLIYQTMFQEPYSECTCWYCEAIRESHTPSTARIIFRRGTHKKIQKYLSRISNEKCGPHISAHNSIESSDREATALAITQKQKLDRMYDKVRKRQEKNGQKPADRNNASAAGCTYPYDVPIIVPYYTPYMADPYITGGLYASDPSCGSYAAGATGNCCQGTCGGGVALGACIAEGGLGGPWGGGCGTGQSGGDDGGADGGGDGGCGGGCGGCG
ncbi:MAG: hypothetical protein L6R37_005384 [Teloschistes peruensis]|nr:MAG: hypothetical protein L6R37_005384 [Teloschistes peruensis]